LLPNQFTGSNAPPQNLRCGKSTETDSILLYKVALEGNIRKLRIRQESGSYSGSYINHCGTFRLKAIDATRRASQTKKRWIDRISLREVHTMSSYPPPPPPPGPGMDGVGARIEEAVELIEMELRHAIAYVNDAVVPQVRKESITALRTVAGKLRDLADKFEQDRSPRR
jgi:hypothetical protein